ncbi:MAG: peptidylprolyl isomerase [Bacteroidales bacterium]|jgi:peptidyl-prolyl cis-trans isomerase SurA|nr:peptidylprolyl isomerase [Bacteroidales bacterium]
MRRKRTVLFAVAGLMLCVVSSNAQTLVESVAAIVGNEVIYLSDVENGVMDLRRSNPRARVDDLRCNTFQELLIAKLFVDQARIDSIIVTDDMVETDLNMQINDAIRIAGSEEALEKSFNKSMVEIRRDVRKALLESQTVSEVQSTITSDLKVTPNDVRRLFNSIPRDSLPVIPSRVQISIIQLDPPRNEENKAEARQKLLDIRSQILAGKSFALLAIQNSEDGSYINGGEVGYKLKGELEKPYADAAWSLSPNTVSRIVESKYGFHIIQMIDKKGDLLNTRHILIRPKVKPGDSEEALARLDSLTRLIRKDSLKFEDAAIRFSTHIDSRINGGKMVSTNPAERINWFSLDELNRDMYTRVRDMKVGEISEPFQTTDDIGNVVFRVVKLDDEIPAHRANLKDDYQYFYNATMMRERQSSYQTWIMKKIETTYIRVSDEFKSCKFLESGWLK